MLSRLSCAGLRELRGLAGYLVFPYSADAYSLQGQIESNYDETVDNFDSMDLKPELLRGMFISSPGSPPL